MNEEIKKIMESREWGPYYIPGRQNWEDFWDDKRRKFPAVGAWRFVLASPLYLLIFLGQRFFRRTRGTVMVKRDTIPPIVPTDFSYKTKEDVRTWIRSMTDEERKELQALYDANIIDSKTARQVLLAEKLKERQPGAFYGEGALPQSFWDILKEINANGKTSITK